ncbi:MAG: SOS response-associated peptidase [Burkholderiales bacterium]
MCVNYLPVTREQLVTFGVALPNNKETWPAETWQDYAAPIIRATPETGRTVLLASYGMVPKSRIPVPVKKYTTMNARAESVGSLRSYAPAWKAAQYCLVPMQYFFEPNWETGKHVRWRIGMRDGSPFAVAGLWRAWTDETGESYSFTQLTVNAEGHDIMEHFHRPRDEKRSLVIIPETHYDDWLNCSNPEVAHTFMSVYPAELMVAAPAPRD